MGLLGWQDGLSYLTIAATVLLVVRLAVFKLYRSYPILFGYWVADIAATALGLWLRRYIAYVYFYAGWEILKLALAVLVVLELYRVALDGHPALAEFGRRVAGSLLLLLAAIAALGLYLGPSPTPDRNPLVHSVLSFERTMDSALVVFLVVLALYLAWFPVRIRRNAAVYIGGFTAYFLARWAATLAVNIYWSEFTRAISVADLSFSLVCLTAWALLMRREGETETVVTGHRWNPEEMERLTGQLSAINARLMRLN